MDKNLLFPLMVILLSFSIVTPYVHAQSDLVGITWEIILVTDTTNCNFSKDLKIRVNVDLIKKYFELYGFDNTLLKTTCLFSAQYLDSPVSSDADLSIIIFDEAIGDKLFVQYGYDGLYAHFGADRLLNHVIMVAYPPRNSTFDSFEYTWILSHELSHFILSYIGYNLESIERSLHSFELTYSDCVHKIGNTQRCSEIKSSIRSDVTGISYNVMTPLPEIVNQNSMKFISNDLFSSYVVKTLHREITGWWLDGLIDDKLYLNAVKHIVDVPVGKNNVIAMSQLSIPNGFSILDETLQNQNTKNSKVLIIPVENKIYDVLDYVPFNTDLIISESDSSEIPDWFKNRAKLWYDMKLDDKIFFDGLSILIRDGIIREN